MHTTCILSSLYLFLDELTAALAEAAALRLRTSSCEIEAADGEGESAMAGKVPRKASSAAAPGGMAAVAEVRACKEATAVVQMELGLMRQVGEELRLCERVVYR